MSDPYIPRKMNPALMTPTEAQQAVGTATTNEVSVSAEFAQEIIDRIQATDAFRVESVTGGQAPVERVNLGGITSPNQFWLRIAIPIVPTFALSGAPVLHSILLRAFGQ